MSSMMKGNLYRGTSESNPLKGHPDSTKTLNLQLAAPALPNLASLGRLGFRV